MKGLFDRFADLRRKAAARTGKIYPIIVIQEAGLDAFWIHRALEQEGVESHVVDAASIAVPRRRRRAKTDRIDGETLLRVLMAYKRGEPRVCAMVRPPSVEEEDRRRLGRERQTLLDERVRHVNRIKGLLFAQGVRDYEPLRRDRRARLEDLRTGFGQPLPAHVTAQIARELDRLELLLGQIKAVEAARDALLAKEERTAPAATLASAQGNRPRIRRHPLAGGVLPQLRQPPADRRLRRARGYPVAQRIDPSRARGLQGRKRRLRTALIQLAWLWRRHQSQSALTLWFEGA